MKAFHTTSLFLLLLLLSTSTFAQRGATIGTWTPYLSYDFTKHLIRDGDYFYCNTKGGYYTWNTQTEEVTAYSPIDGLSDVDASAMHLDSASGFVFLGFEDGNINYFKKPFGKVSYMSDIKRTDLFTSKGIKKFASKDNLLYIATDFGVVIFDIEKEETKSSITKVSDNPSGTPVNDILIVNDTLYLCMGNAGLYYTHLNQPNITVPTVWSKADGNRGMSLGEADFITSIGEHVYAMVGDTCYNKKPGNNWKKGPMPSLDMDFFQATDSSLYCGYGNYIRVQPWDTSQYLVVTQIGAQVAYIDSQFTIYGDKIASLKMVVEPDTFLVIGPDGPHTNNVTEIGVGNGEMYIAPQGQQAETSAPNHEVDGFFYFNRSTGWKNFNVEDELYRDSIHLDFARLHFNPETGVCYMGSWGQGMLRVKDELIEQIYTGTNSDMSPVNEDDQRITGLDMDENGNLWVTAILADYNLKALSPDGAWHHFILGGTYPTNLIIDDWGNKWIINNGLGITVFNENGTFDVTSDDQSATLSAASGSGGLPNAKVTALAKDRNGHIWVGTLEGIGVYANPSRVFDNNFPDASCPVIDGFCLLKDQRVRSIEVDGANRKWIGTDNGVYIVNPQGNRLIDHLTTENSPLFSNQINDIEIDPQTGEIFFGTSKGLVSFMGDAIAGKENSEKVYVFPNPVFTDYDGPIAISCSFTDVEVKITTASGILVRELDALGGQAVWDGRDRSGNKVTPGIYLAMVASVDGKNAGIAKFAVIAR